MKTYKENDTVIYTDGDNNRIDTFVIFDTNRETGLTHINHCNLQAGPDDLELHPNSLTGNLMPLADVYSFMLYNKLKYKYADIDKNKPAVVLHRDINDGLEFAKAS